MENELENKSESKSENKVAPKFEKTISQLSGSARRYKDSFELHLVLTVDNLRNCQQLQTLVDLAYHLGIISNSDKLLYTSQLNDFGEYCDFLN